MREIDRSPTVVEPEASSGCDSDSGSDKDEEICSSAEPAMSYSVPSRRPLRETISFDVNVIFDCLFSESEIRRGQTVGPTEAAEKDNIARLFLSINSELLSRSLESLPTVPDREPENQRPICGNSLNPTLVKAIQEDVAHVLSEKCLDARPRNKICPYHVNVMSLAQLPPNESAGSTCASASSSNCPPRQHQEEEWDQQPGQQEQEQRTRYQLSLSVLLPRGVSAQSVREVVREEVHDASSVWRRSAPPFYSLDPLYIRNVSATAVSQTSREGIVAVSSTQIEPKQLSEGLPPRHLNKQHREDGETAEEREHMVGEQGSAQHEQVDDGRITELICPKGSSSTPTADYRSDSKNTGKNGRQSDGICSSDNDDSDEETTDDDSDEDDEAPVQDPATQAFAAAIDRGSSAQDACLVGLAVVCRLLREGGVPQAALEALQDQTRKAFRHARIKGATPLEAWRLVGESAESGDLF